MFTNPIRSRSFPPSAKEANSFQNQSINQSSSSSSILDRIKNLRGLNKKKKDEDEASPERKAFADSVFELGERMQFELLCKIGAEDGDSDLIEKGLEALKNRDKNKVSKDPERFEILSTLIRENSDPEFADAWLKMLRSEDADEVSQETKGRADNIVKMVNQAQKVSLIKMSIDNDDIEFIKQIFGLDEANEEMRELFFKNNYFLPYASNNQATTSKAMFETLLDFCSQTDKLRTQNNKTPLDLATNL